MEYRTRDFYILRLEADVLLNSFYFHFGFFMGFFFIETILSPANNGSFVSSFSILMPFIYFSYLVLLVMTAIMLAEAVGVDLLISIFDNEESFSIKLNFNKPFIKLRDSLLFLFCHEVFFNLT